MAVIFANLARARLDEDDEAEAAERRKSGHFAHVHSRTHKDLRLLDFSPMLARQQMRTPHDKASGRGLEDDRALEHTPGPSDPSFPDSSDLAQSLAGRLKAARERQKGLSEHRENGAPHKRAEEVQQVLDAILLAVRSHDAAVRLAGSVLLDYAFDELSQLLLENRGAESDAALLIVDILSHAYDSSRSAVCNAAFLEKVAQKLSLPPTRKNRQASSPTDVGACQCYRAFLALKA